MSRRSDSFDETDLEFDEDDFDKEEPGCLTFMIDDLPRVEGLLPLYHNDHKAREAFGDISTNILHVQGQLSVENKLPPTKDEAPENKLSATPGKTLTDNPAQGKERDPNLVTWNGPKDMENPRNWPRKTKWIQTGGISFYFFMSALTTSMIAPALLQIAESLSTSTWFERQAILSISVLAISVGVLIFPPLSELYGRLLVLQLTNLLFLVFNIGCGFVHTTPQMLALRCIAGFGASGCFGIGGGTMNDLWEPKERAAAVGIYTLAPVLGPALGPVIGGWIAERASWRWIFYSISIADGVVQIIGFILFRETNPIVLLRRKKNRLIRMTGNKELFTEFEKVTGSPAQHISRALRRPLRMLFTHPIIQIFGAYSMLTNGIFYLTLSSFSELFIVVYHQSVGISGLHFISMGIAFVFGTQIFPRVSDWIYKYLMKRNKSPGKPEFRLPGMIPSMLLVPSGLLLYGWSAEYKLFWIIPDIGVFLFSLGLTGTLLSSSLYLLETYRIYAASATGAIVTVRSLGGFGFPLAAPYMYASLGYGWGASLLALLSVLIGLPIPLLLWKYGERLRKLGIADISRL